MKVSIADRAAKVNEGKGNALLVLALAGEGELVLGLAIGDLVDTEPLVGSTEKAREVTLNVLNVVELRSQRVVDVDDNDLPVGLLLVQQGHHTEHLDLLDLTGVADELADLADVQRVVVTLGLGLRVDNVGVLPGLGKVSHEPSKTDNLKARLGWTYAREGTVVPEVTLVGEAVTDVTELALLDILLDGVEELLLGDLDRPSAMIFMEKGTGEDRGGAVLWRLVRTSCLALVQRGISTIMFRMVCCSLA